MEATDQELNEGFGEFMSKTFGMKKPDQTVIDKLRADRLKIRTKTGAKQKEIDKQKDDLWTQSKQKVERNKANQANMKDEPPRLSMASKGRAGEMDWVKNMAVECQVSEGVMSNIHLELQELFPYLEDGKIDLNDVFMGRHKGITISKETVQFLQGMYDDVVVDFRLHPDDDFEKIETKVFNKLAKDFG
jgi:hypothetical protein